MEKSEFTDSPDFPVQPVKPHNKTRLEKSLDLKTANQLIESLWPKLKSIAAELSNATGFGVLVATGCPELGTVDYFTNRDEELYLSLPCSNHPSCSVKVKPRDCERCFQLSSKDVAIQVEGSPLKQECELLEELSGEKSRYREDFFDIDDIAIPNVNCKVEWKFDPVSDKLCSEDFSDAHDIDGIHKELSIVGPKPSTRVKNNVTHKDVSRKKPKLPKRKLKPLLEEAEEGEAEDSAKKELSQIDRKRVIFPCAECGKILTNKRGYIRHMWLHNGESPYKCTICEKTLYKAEALEVHMRSHTGEKPFKCEYCDGEFSNPGCYRKHLQMHTGVKFVKCDVCNMLFRSRQHLRKHSFVHAATKPYKCEQCGKEYCSQSALSRHVVIHSDERPYLCNICGDAFRASDKLKDHLAGHNVETPFHCKSCGKGFWRNGKCAYHELTCNINRFKCERCGKTFSTKMKLERHVRVHTGEKPFQCSDCGKSFSQEFPLKIHACPNTGDNPFTCDVCGKKFANSVNLKHHANMHVACQLCGKIFVNTASLKSHQVVHSGEKPFPCDICEKKFTNQANLKRHKLIHDGLKPYKCDQCGRSFTASDTLKNHMRTHTGEKPWKCDVCDRAYSDSRALKNHKLKLHSDITAV